MAEAKAVKSGFKISTILVSVVLLVIGTLSASYLATETFDFGGQFMNLQGYYRKHALGVMR